MGFLMQSVFDIQFNGINGSFIINTKVSRFKSNLDSYKLDKKLDIWGKKSILNNAKKH